jgi:APA family basic amino acid/polyamine antiporter
MDLFRRKSVTDLQQEAETDHSLKRALGALNLTMLGIGAIIGTGIFVLTGTVAAQNVDPRWSLLRAGGRRLDLRRAVLR